MHLENILRNIIWILWVLSDIITQSSKGESVGSNYREKGSNYQNETVEPCYFSSSIYYGGQENYSPITRSTESPHMVRVEFFNP